MSNRARWASNVAGEQCPFDAPRANIAASLHEVQRLSIATLYLERIQTYRGHCVLVFDPRHVTRIDELSAAEWQLMAQDIQAAERALMSVFRPDHVNIASIGQVVAHLHWHLVPRYFDDPRWGGPIWMTTPAEMLAVHLDDAEYEVMATSIRKALGEGAAA